MLHKNVTLLLPAAILACVSLHGQSAAVATAENRVHTLTNPLLPSGPDPWVIYKDGYYYYTNSTAKNITLWRTRRIENLKTATKKIVWTPPASGPYSHEIWAPELHLLRDKWYIYFSADSGTNFTHRVWVLENAARDPLEGEWTFKGKLSDSEDKWAIDGTVFENRGRLYFAWSGWEDSVNGVQSIYIAELENPWTVKSHRVRLSVPEYPWEKVGDLVPKKNREANPAADIVDPVHVDVNEGPEILKHGNRIFLLYSASGCWTDYYELGMLSASDDSNLLDPKSWSKRSSPVFWQSPQASVFAPGHNGFFTSPDGKEDWIIYHANSKPGLGCGPMRAPHAQKFTWNDDGSPNFGRPIPEGVPVAAPSGETE